MLSVTVLMTGTELHVLKIDLDLTCSAAFSSFEAIFESLRTLNDPSSRLWRSLDSLYVTTKSSIFVNDYTIALFLF